MLLTLPIREVLEATPRTRIVRLDLCGRTFEYRPGQAVFVGLHGGKRRMPYSIAAGPEDARCEGCLELLVRTEQIDSPVPALPMQQGAKLDVEGPVGQFTLPPNLSSGRLVFIAGGTGIAPLRSMLRHALAVPQVQLHVLYSARTSDEFPYQEELRQLSHEGRIHLIQTVTRDTAGSPWTGARGRIGRAELEVLVQDKVSQFFICGPLAFVQHTSGLLADLGASPERIRVDRW